jgi:hypothetical protein
MPMKLSIPVSGERWQAGSSHFLAWKGAPDARVDYSLDAGTTWQTVPDDGTDRRPPEDIRFAPSTLSRLLWKAPEAPGKICRLRITPPSGFPQDAATTEIHLAPSAERRYRWEEVTRSAPFAPRDGGGALTFDGRMWLLGGWNPEDQVHFPNDCNSEVWSSADGRAWDLVNPAAPWEKRHTAGYAVHRDCLWVVGGDPIQGHYQNDVWRSPDGVKWTCVQDSVPWAPRVLHHTVAHAGKLWVIGGQTLPDFAPAPRRYYRDVWCSADGIRWECVQPEAPWEPRGQIGGSAVKNGYIWIIGGGQYYERYYPDVWRSRDGVAWECVCRMAPWYPRYYHEVAVYDDRLWLLEGISRTMGNRRDVWYSSDGLNWYEVPDTPWEPRHAASVFVHAGALWVAAGNRQGNSCRNDVWKLTPLP